MNVEAVLQAKKIAILGFGSEGRSTWRFLEREGVEMDRVTILDGNIDSDLPDGAKAVLGDKYLEGLDGYDVIFKTPGISPYDEPLASVSDKLVSNTEMFLQLYQSAKGRVIAITGSKGKSTTSTLLTHALESAGKKVILLGNIGKPVLDALPELQDADYEYVVFEMSSYMIQSLRQAKIFACVIVNIYQAHMIWHHGLENYQRDKLRLAGFCENVVVYHPTQTLFEQFFDDLDVDVIDYGDGGDYYEAEKEYYHDGHLLGSLDNFPLLGRHNRINVCGVLAVCHGLLGLELVDVKGGLEKTQPLKHRLTDVGTYKGIRFFDDSIATTPESTQQALETMNDEKLPVGTLFIGGVSQEFDYTLLIKTIIDLKVPNIVFFPDSGPEVKELLDAQGYDYNSITTRDMKEAVQFAYDHSSEGSAALLSCAGESFSCFTNYKERGNLFIQYAQELGEA